MRSGAVWAVGLFVLTACSAPPVTPDPGTPAGEQLAVPPDGPAGARVVTGALKVLSLNVAHGRRDGLNQLLLSEKSIRANLAGVATLLEQAQADVVGLQEADGPSLWSGNFDHVAFLARQADYPWHARAGHARSWLYDYGTALLARVPLVETFNHAFAQSPPTTTKGFLLGQIDWRPTAGTEPAVRVDIVSVHLDFSRARVRRQQIAEMATALAGRTNPLIVLGDFNSDWHDDQSVVYDLARRCRLRAYQPTDGNLGTYRNGKRRLDWILISDELEFRSYAVLPAIVSDHYAVSAEVVFRDGDRLRHDQAARHGPCRT